MVLHELLLNSSTRKKSVAVFLLFPHPLEKIADELCMNDSKLKLASIVYKIRMTAALVEYAPAERKTKQWGVKL